MPYEFILMFLNETRLRPEPKMYNGLAMMVTSLHPRFAAHRFAGPAIAAGGLLFSGSIFALVLARDR